MHIQSRRSILIILLMFGFSHCSFALSESFFIGNKIFFADLFKEHLFKMHKCFTESDDKILCKKLYVKFGQNEDQMTRKTICNKSYVGLVVKNGREKCRKLYNSNKKNEYELFLYKSVGYYYGYEKFDSLIPEMLSDNVEISSREYSLKGEKARYFRVMFSIRYLIPKGEEANGRKIYTQLPQTFSFSRIILFFPEKLNISSVDDFKKHADKIVVNFTYVGEDYSSHYSYF